MSSASKACGPIIIEKWIPVPDVNSHCVNEVAKLGVTQFNKKYDYSLKFEKIYEGWFREVASKKLQYKLHIKALDHLRRSLNYELVVDEEKTPTEKIRNFASLIVIVTDGHNVGNVKLPVDEKWVKIPNLLYPFIQTVAKFSVDEHNKKHGDSLRYESTYDGWYAEIGLDNLKCRLYLKAKDCLGRVHNYNALVRVDQSLTLKVKTLLSFSIIENWIKIPDLKQHCVQVVVKFAVDWVITKYGVIVKWDSIYDGWYLELGPHSVKFRLLIKALDILGRLLNYEIVVVQEKLPNGETIRKVISITVLPTPGHYVAIHVKPPPEKKWIKISNLPTIKLFIELAKWALEKIKNETGDYLIFDVVFEVWYCELGGDDIEFRIVFKAKDCIGRVITFEVTVLIQNFTTTKVQVFGSFKICNT